MLASEVINAYEAFCPQEFSMEGDSRGRVNWNFGQGYPKGHGCSGYS